MKFSAMLQRIVVASITSTIRGLPSEVVIDERHGMATRCAITLDNIATVDKGPLEAPKELITVLDARVMIAVRQALLFSLGFQR